MKERELSQFLSEIAAGAVPADTNIWPAVRARLNRSSITPTPGPAHRGLPRLAGVPLALLLAVSLAVAGIGPQRVWADIKRLLGYVPGIGFANLEQALVLAAPVEVTRDGVSVIVEQAIAGPQSTQIVLRSVGLPPDDSTGGVTGGGGEADTGIGLRLPGGQILAPTQWAWRYGGATLEFPALPPGANQFTLELARLPLVPAGRAPENWVLGLTLQPATGPVVAGLFSQPYRPGEAADTHDGITLQVLQVAHSPAETAVRVQAGWEDPQAQIRYLMGGRTQPVLRDDRGNSYQQRMPSNSGSAAGLVARALPEGSGAAVPAPGSGALETELAFEAISGDARQLTLEVDGVEVEVPAGGQFVVDLGASPAPGDIRPVDVTLDVAGFPVHLSEARLVEEEFRLRDGNIKRTILQFEVDPVAGQDGRELHMVWLRGESPAFNGGGGGYNFDTNQIRASLNVQDGARVPSGTLTVTVTGARIVQFGPWQVTWQIPGR